MYKAVYKGIIGVLFLSLNFSSPSGAQTEKNEIQEIAVVSLLGDFFVGRGSGAPKSNNWWYTPVPEWGVNNMVQSTLLDYLEEHKKISSIPWTVKDANLLTCVHQFTISGDCEKALFAAAKERGFEYILVVRPKSTYQFAATQVESFAKTHGEKIPGGYGFIGLGGANCVYALFSIGVYKVESGKTLGLLLNNEKLIWYFSGLPCYSKRYRDKETEKKIRWKDSFDKYSAKEKELMKSYIERGIKENLSELLPKLKLFKD